MLPISFLSDSATSPCIAHKENDVFWQIYSILLRAISLVKLLKETKLLFLCTRFYIWNNIFPCSSLCFLRGNLGPCKGCEAWKDAETMKAAPQIWQDSGRHLEMQTTGRNKHAATCCWVVIWAFDKHQNGKRKGADPHIPKRSLWPQTLSITHILTLQKLSDKTWRMLLGWTHWYWMVLGSFEAIPVS